MTLALAIRPVGAAKRRGPAKGENAQTPARLDVRPCGAGLLPVGAGWLPEMGGQARQPLRRPPEDLSPPVVPVCPGRPSSAAPDLTCSVSIARERTNYKRPIAVAMGTPPFYLTPQLTTVPTHTFPPPRLQGSRRAWLPGSCEGDLRPVSRPQTGRLVKLDHVLALSHEVHCCATHHSEPLLLPSPRFDSVTVHDLAALHAFSQATRPCRDRVRGRTGFFESVEVDVGAALETALDSPVWGSG
jgi:hypothetical protein